MPKAIFEVVFQALCCMKPPNKSIVTAVKKLCPLRIDLKYCREVQKALQRAREDLSSAGTRGQLLKLTAATFPSNESIAYIDNASSV